jgi:predicted nucleic acid-binding protein
MPTFVLNNSVICGWLLESRSTDYTEAVARRLQSEHAVAPPLLVLEYANVLRTACRRQVLTASQAGEMLAMLAALPIDIDPGASDAALVLDLALRHDLTAYDAQYLSLALHHRLPIATQDQDLARAALVVGVGVLAG